MSLRERQIQAATVELADYMPEDRTQDREVRAMAERAVAACMDVFGVELLHDETVERVASAIAIEEGYDPNCVPFRQWSAAAMAYRRLARAALKGVLGDR